MYDVKVLYDLALALVVLLYIAFFTISVGRNLLLTTLITVKLRFLLSLVKVIKVYRLIAMSSVYS